MSIIITWLGHAAFLLDINGHSVLLDPFITDNPLATVTANELNPEMILLSHAHDDHVGDSVDIAKRSGARLLCNFEIGNWLLANGISDVVQLNPGGTYQCDFLSARWTIAHHSSSFHDGTYGGQPNGYVINAHGKRIYFAGDTDVFLDMQLIGDLNIDVAILPIGGTYTMGPDEALKAVEFIRPRVVIPMHYNTFPPIMQNAFEWANRVNNFTKASPIVLDPGASHTID